MELIHIRARGLVFPALAAGKGPLVLCLHGFPDGMRSFRHQLPALSARGFRAVAPTLRGYGPTCLGDESSSHALEAAKDAVAIVQALGESQAHLVGHDWGAAIAYLAAALAPQMWHSVAALAVPHPLGLLAALPTHPRQLALSSYMAFFQARGIAEAALRTGDFALVAWLWRKWSPGFTPEAGELSHVKNAFSEPSVLRHALAYYRVLSRPLREPMTSVRRLLAAPLTPRVLGLVGARDGCISADVFERAMHPSRFASVRTERVPDVGHFLHQEAPELVNGLLCGWIRDSGPEGQHPAP